MGRPSKYPAEFRQEAVQLVRDSGRPRAEIARSLGLSDSTLKNWVVADRAERARASDPNALSEDERAELARLRKENLELRTDREILRKAAAISWPGEASAVAQDTNAAEAAVPPGATAERPQPGDDPLGEDAHAEQEALPVADESDQKGNSAP